MTYKLGTVVPQKRGATSSRITNTVAVQTPEGDIYSDVLILYPNEQTYFVPAVGSQVIISFFDELETKAFIIGYTHQAKIGVQRVPQASDNRETESNSYTFTTNSERSKLELLGDTFVSSLADLHTALNTLKASAASIDVSYEGKTEKANHLTSEINYVEATIETLVMELTDCITKFKTKSENIEKWLIKADEQRAQISKLVTETDTTTLTANNTFTVKCDTINLGSDAPMDAPVLYTKLQSILSDLLTALQTLTVTCSAPSSPSSPPVNMAQFAALSARLNTLKATKVALE